MSARATTQPSLPAGWPLAASLLLTAAVTAFVCEPPVSPMRSWAQILSRATIYLCVAVAVHALAVWGVCRVRDETESAAPSLIWSLIWAAWIAVVWLPLLALLTFEHSPWVALVLPVTAIFATLLLHWSVAHAASDTDRIPVTAAAPQLFQLDQSDPLWRLLLPSVVTSLAAQLGVAMLAAGHTWTSGCLFGAAILYPWQRWLDRKPPLDTEINATPSRSLSAGNSLLVWVLIVLALVPFMVGYAAGEINALFGLKPRALPTFGAPALLHSPSRGYTGIILIAPHKPNAFVAPTTSTTELHSKNPHVIAFDGAYWYFKQPYTRPAPNARVAHGDPIKNHIFSTDRDPLIMEAHQPLAHPVTLSCCRSLRVNVSNADNVPGTIALEVLLRDTSSIKQTKAISLGTIVLPSSTVSPMPLHRAPVDDRATFPLPAAARGRPFDEITVRIKPEHSRSLAGASVSIQDFVFQP